VTGAVSFAAAAEAGTGVALLVAPELVARLLFGSEVAGVGTVAARFAGIALVGLGVACRPVHSGEGARRGMLVYGILATVYLAYLGASGGPAGLLLWPAVALHGAICLWLARGSREERSIS
jgi:hypothetical protein